jgi:hypothetical protein
MNIQHRTFNAQHPMVGRVTSAVAWLWRDKPCAPQTKIREQPALVVECFSDFAKA